MAVTTRHSLHKCECLDIFTLITPLSLIAPFIRTVLEESISPTVVVTRLRSDTLKGGEEDEEVTARFEEGVPRFDSAKDPGEAKDPQSRVVGLETELLYSVEVSET